MKLKRLLIPFFLLIALQSMAQGYKIKTIVIDPGHGGRAAGAVGKISMEKNVSLEVALKLGKMFEEELPGIKIIFTRKTDISVDIYKRAEMANNAKADIFISIHCNSMPVGSRPTFGTETIVAGFGRIDEQDAALRENADIKLEKNYKANYGGFDPSNPETLIILSLLKNVFREKSILLAKYMQSNYTNINKRVNRGVKEQNLVVLQRAGMPAVLTEIGFINNPVEEKYMNSEEGQIEIARGIIDSVKKYKKDVEN